jgi:accessory gene regulator B
MELAYPEEQRQVIAYGLTAIFQTVFMTAIVLVLGAILHIFVESAILCFAVSILRKYSGGTHASSIGSCTIIGVVFCIVSGIAMKALSTLAVPPGILVIACALTYATAFFVAIQKAPVDSPNKPIRTEKKRKKMKKATIIVISVYMVISAVLIFNSDRSVIFVGSLFCLLLSVIWQMSSLTNPGRIVLEGLDRLVYRIITFGRRT